MAVPAGGSGLVAALAASEADALAWLALADGRPADEPPTAVEPPRVDEPPPVAACATLGAGLGVRRVILAITMPIAAQSAASAISWVPISRRSSGPIDAACAARAVDTGAALGVGVTAGIDGSSEPMFPPMPDGLVATSGREVLDRGNVPVVDEADPPALVAPAPAAERCDGAGAGGTDTVTAAHALTVAFGLALVARAVSLTCSPLVLEVGTVTAA